MPRPHIEFIQTQVLPWQENLYASARPGADAKPLSRDPETGAASVLFRYPEGWSQEAGALRADEEFYVIDGALDLGGTVFGHDTYGYHPAGTARGPASAPDGAVVVTFFESDPESGTPPDTPDAARLIEYCNLFDGDWTVAGSPGFPPGGFKKLLREDPYTRDQTWVLSTVAFRQAAAAEIHPTVEEMYLLAGSVCGNCGIMRPGAYFWRPEGVPHGPYGTTTGTLYLFRTKGGALSTVYDKPTGKPFDWNPPYAPVLPPELERYRDRTLDWIGNY